MCGIAGYLTFQAEKPNQKITKAMCDQITHRGPDDEGYFTDNNIALGMRRLKIIDLAGGHQPICNENETIWVVCNGEIYNFAELRRDLEKKGHLFKTKSDVEVLVHLYEEYSDDFVKKINGMFAIALWDKAATRLILARDRLGKKPLYYMQTQGDLIFASEIKSLIKHPKTKKNLDFNSLSRYLTLEYVPTPYSIFKDIYKLSPGHTLIADKQKTEISCYWDATFGDHNNIASDTPKRAQDIVPLLDNKLFESVRKRLVSDVPLGVFLSGGLDSSTIAYYMSQITDNVESFSIGFTDPSFDESGYARRVAKFLGTTHHEQILEPHDLYDLVPQISTMLDEPLADASIIPTYLLSKFSRQNVTVALGGDGGDELFMGYPTFQAERLARFYGLMPKLLRKKLIEPAIYRLPTSFDNIALDFKLKKFISGMNYPKEARHQFWLGSFNEGDKGKLFTCEVYNKIMPGIILKDLGLYPKLEQLSKGNRVIYLYLKQYLLDDILVKVDRASMFTSLEVRAPFLDYNLVEFINSIPAKYKLKGYKTKYILKKLMEDKLPKDIVYRKKKGFGIPVAKWIRGPLKEFSLEVLNKQKIEAQGIFNYSYILQLLDEHMSGKKDNRKYLWTLISFQLWSEKWIG